MSDWQEGDPEELVPQRQTARYEPHAPRARRYRMVCRPALPIKTQGAIPQGRAAWIYVASGARGTKIGMSTAPIKRARSLRGTIEAVFPVVPAMARVVETAVLARLGAKRRDGEWVTASVEEAVAAATTVMEEYRRMAHVDPHLTQDEARRLRIRLACGNGIP